MGESILDVLSLAVSGRLNFANVRFEGRECMVISAFHLPAKFS